MYSYLFGTYYYIDDIVKMIDEIDKDRRKMKYIGETLTTTFAQDLKLKLKLENVLKSV
tara:strand:+ start:6053 stop:6226 length:174 start_codon:yes stop_codon:yes gene_type:complete